MNHKWVILRDVGLLYFSFWVLSISCHVLSYSIAPLQVRTLRFLFVFSVESSYFPVPRFGACISVVRHASLHRVYSSLGPNRGPSIHSSLPPSLHTYIHTSIHPYIHPYIHICTHRHLSKQTNVNIRYMCILHGVSLSLALSLYIYIYMGQAYIYNIIHTSLFYINPCTLSRRRRWVRNPGE